MEKLIKEFARLKKTQVLKIRDGEGEDQGKTVFIFETGSKFIMTEKELQSVIDEIKAKKAKEPNFEEPIEEVEEIKTKSKKGDK